MPSHATDHAEREPRHRHELIADIVELRKALHSIASLPDEDNEWHGVDLYRQARSMAWMALKNGSLYSGSVVSETAATTWAEEAAEDIESWASYASAYFQEKHDLAGTLKKWRDRANGNSSDRRNEIAASSTRTEKP